MVRNPPTNTGDVRDVGLISKSGRSHREGHGTPLQNSCLENPMDGGPWQATVHSVANSGTGLMRLSMHAFTWNHNLTLMNLALWHVSGYNDQLNSACNFTELNLGRKPVGFPLGEGNWGETNFKQKMTTIQSDP